MTQNEFGEKTPRISGSSPEARETMDAGPRDFDTSQVGPCPVDLTKPGLNGHRNGSVHQVGRYRILERLGQGGMATVYKAFDPAIDRAIAIKFLHPSLCLDEGYRGRFLRESKAAGVLAHPNIVTVYDVGEIEGQPYIAMELLDGAPLSEVLTQGTPLPVRAVVEIAIQLARALDYAHSKGVIHRDIKPSNIVRLKGTNTIKVTDFGIAHVGDTNATQHTKLGDVLGTPEYMSPEQAQGQRVDSRSDLFSVGVVLFHLLTGERPFEADSAVNLMYRIAKEEPKPLDKRRSDIPASLRRVVDRCLKKQPQKRFQTGAEVADALIAVAQELDEQAREKSEKRIVPLRLQWTLLMGVVVALTMAITAAFVTQRQHTALMNQVVDYGASLSRFMATESAVPVLSEDWIAIETFVQEVMRNQDFAGISVVDHTGIVRASSDAQIVGQPHQEPVGERLESRDKATKVLRYRNHAAVAVLDFQVPVTFQNKNIGHAHLTLFEQPLSTVKRVTYLTMGVLVVITVVCVVLVTYLLADRFSKPIRVLRKAIREIGRGKYDRRIDQQRNDEFGLLYQAFDEMAAELQRKMENLEHPATDQALASNKDDK